ncbi:hypothetical protein MUK42_34005, partial [Musa troglodytarum]
NISIEGQDSLSASNKDRWMYCTHLTAPDGSGHINTWDNVGRRITSLRFIEAARSRSRSIIDHTVQVSSIQFTNLTVPLFGDLSLSPRTGRLLSSPPSTINTNGPCGCRPSSSGGSERSREIPRSNQLILRKMLGLVVTHEVYPYTSTMT